MIKNLLILAIATVVIALIGQQLTERYSKDNEPFRKLFHVLHGVILAVLAFIVPLRWIVALEIIFFVSMIITRYIVYNNNRLLKWVSYLSKAYRVGRVSYGEFFYPISIIIIVLFANTKWEFVAATLILALADTAAAIVGRKWGKSSSYKVLGQKKSLLGSLAFFVVCSIIVFAYTVVAPHIISVGLGTILLISLFITFSENVGVFGSDNLLIPLATVFVLNSL